MTIRYYIPIQSVNLAHYYSSGIICPANYIKNRNRDIQNRFYNYLLLATEKFTTETDCSLEIVFNESEEKPTQISNTQFYLFDMPIPISRVKNICFQREDQKKNTVFNITSGAAFLPLNFITVDQVSPKIETKTLNDFSPKATRKNWKIELSLFDRMLGGIGLFPISKKQDENYPINYFSVLANINSKIKEQLELQQITTKDYSWAFESNSQFKTLNEIIYSDVDDRLIQSVAQKDEVEIKSRNGLYLFDSIPSKTNTYLASILASYGSGKRKKIDDFFSDFFSGKFDSSRMEGIAFIFGINKGYSSFRNTYKTNTFQIDVKFRLDSQLDYYSIESVYQFVFNQKSTSTQFSYIDNWCPKYINEVNSKRSSFKILDKTIFTERAVTPNVLNEISNNFMRLLKKWFTVFQPVDSKSLKEEIESNVSSYLEIYRESIIEKEKESIQSIIDAKNAKISSLEEQLRLLKLQNSKEKTSEEGSLVAEPKAPYNKTKSTSTGNLDLFASNNSNLTEESIRADELFNLGIGKLKEIAKEHSIKSLSKYKKEDKSQLAREILKVEFPKT